MMGGDEDAAVLDSRAFVSSLFDDPLALFLVVFRAAARAQNFPPP
jgi:hypothetical protein